MKLLLPLALSSIALSVGCGGVSSTEQARIASLGLDAVVSRVLALGFAGFNAASSANIPEQSADGDDSGTVVVTGQVDQGSSDNKGMRLNVTLTEFADDTIDDPETDDTEELVLVYSTPEDGPLDVDLSLRDIPSGTLSGTVAGTVLLEGDLEGEIDVALSLAGTTESDGADGTRRVEDSTAVTGTVTSPNGEYDVDFSL